MGYLFKYRVSVCNIVPSWTDGTDMSDFCGLQKDPLYPQVFTEQKIFITFMDFKSNVLSLLKWVTVKCTAINVNRRFGNSLNTHYNVKLSWSNKVTFYKLLILSILI